MDKNLKSTVYETDFRSDKILCIYLGKTYENHTEIHNLLS